MPETALIGQTRTNGYVGWAAEPTRQEIGLVHRGRFLLHGPNGVVDSHHLGAHSISMTSIDAKRVAAAATAEAPAEGQNLPEEHPNLRPMWCWYDRVDHQPGPTISELANSAQIAVFGGGMWTVDRMGHANRLTFVEVNLGYRWTEDGNTSSTGTLAMRPVTPEKLSETLGKITGDSDMADSTGGCNEL